GGGSGMSQDVGQAAGARSWRAGGARLSREAGGGIAAVVLLLIAIIFPLVITDQVATQIGVDTMLFVAATVAWNMFSGFTGYISLGAAVFFGTGAYTVGIAAQDWNITGNMEFALLPLAALAAGVVAVPFGLIALRVRRHAVLAIPIPLL